MMHTKEQGSELIDHTDHEWTTVNGVNGRKFTSKNDTSKYIFLPAGGGWYDTTHSGAGMCGSYWSTKWNSSSKAFRMYVYSLDAFYDNVTRRDGQSIRAVR